MREEPDQLDLLLDAALDRTVADQPAMTDDAFDAGKAKVTIALATGNISPTPTEPTTGSASRADGHRG